MKEHEVRYMADQ